METTIYGKNNTPVVIDISLVGGISSSRAFTVSIGVASAFYDPSNPAPYFKVVLRCGSWTTYDLGPWGMSKTPTNHSFTIPMSALTGLKNSFEGPLYATVYYGQSANALNSQKTIQLDTVHFPTSELSPTITTTFSDVSGIPSAWGLRAGLSKIRASVSSREFKYDACMKSYTVSLAGQSSSSIPAVFSPIATAGTYRMKTVMIDSRNMGVSVTRNIQILPYTPPTISNISVVRCNEEGDPEQDGTKARIIWDASVDQLPAQTQNVTLKHRQRGSSSWSTVTLSSLSGSEVLDVQFDTDKEYEFSLSVADAVKSVTKETTLPRSFVTIDFLAGGNGVSIGEAATEELFSCNMPARFKKSVILPDVCVGAPNIKNGAVSWEKIDSGVRDLINNVALYGIHHVSMHNDGVDKMLELRCYTNESDFIGIQFTNTGITRRKYVNGTSTNQWSK